MKYLVIETLNGELFHEVWLFKSPEEAFRFIESCAWATNRDFWLESPVVEAVDDDYEMPKWLIDKSIKRFKFGRDDL